MMIMNNILAIVLVLTPLLTCTSLHQDHREVIVKEGHHAVVVEYDKDPKGSTKVSISPPDTSSDTSNNEKQAGGMFSGTRDLICDAYGKCKHKLADALVKTKDAVPKEVHGVTDEAQEVKKHAKEALKEAIEKIPSEAKDKASEKAKAGIFGKAKKLFGDAIAIFKDVASKDFNVIDSPKRTAEDISRNVTGALGEVPENVKEQAKETVKVAQKVWGKSLNGILYKFKEVAYDVIWYILFRDKMGSLVGLIHILGFSTAYGMCVWVTFVSSYVLGRCLPRQTFGMVQGKIYPVYLRAMGFCVFAALLGHVVGQKEEFLASKLGLFQTLSLVFALLMVLTNMIWLEPKTTEAMYRRMKLEKEEGRVVGVSVAAKDWTANSDGATMVNGKGTRLAYGRGLGVAVKDGMANGGRRARVAIAAEDGVEDGGCCTRSVVVDRQEVLRLNERLKKLNAYSSAQNMFTLVALTWHMAYLGQRLQGYTVQ